MSLSRSKDGGEGGLRVHRMVEETACLHMYRMLERVCLRRMVEERVCLCRMVEERVCSMHDSRGSGGTKKK